MPRSSHAGLPLAVLAEDVLQGANDLPEGGMAPHGLLDRPHQVVVVSLRSRGGLADRVESGVSRPVGEK
jgi:hypothetical protein